MNNLLDNLLQVTLGFALLCLMSLPSGWLTLRWLGLRLGALSLPVAALLGLLILPLYFNLLGAIIKPLTLEVRAAAWVVLNLSLGFGGGSLPRGSPTHPTSKRQYFTLSLIASIALLLTLFPLLLHDVPIEGRWYYVMAGDWIKHIGVGNGLAADESLPPHNPFLSTETHLRYYYFAYILPSMIARLSDGAISVTSSLTAFAVLLAFGLPFLLFAYGREAGLTAPAALFTTFLVILVSGLDILYVVDERRRLGYWVEHIDFWANHDLRRINSLSSMFIWTPQHVLGIAGAIFVLWFIHVIWQPQPFRGRIKYTLAIAVLIAALDGTSSFVWFGLMVGLGGFIVLEVLRGVKRLPAPLFFLMAAILLSFVLSLPYLTVVGQRGEAPAALEISPTVKGIKYGGIFSQLFGAHPLTYVLDFPFQMGVEFGLVMLTGFMGCWGLRRGWSAHVNVRLWTVMALTSYLIVLAVRPDRPDSNNYAARVAPLLWVISGIWSGFWWMRLREAHLRHRLAWSAVCSLLILAGLASTLYESWIEQGSNYQKLLGYPTSTQRNNSVTESQHELYEWLDEHVGWDEIYQIGWETNQATYFVQRRAGVTAGYLALLYVSDPALFYVSANAALELGFNSPDPAQAAGAFKHIGIDYIVTTYNQPQNVTLASRGAAQFANYFTLVFEIDGYQVYRIHDSLRS